MKNNRKFLMGMLTAVLVILAACENSSDKSSARLDNQSQNNNSTLNTNDDSLNAVSTEDASKTDNTNEDTIDTGNNDANEKVDTTNNVLKKVEDFSTNNTASLKEGYLNKLNDAKNEVEEMRKNPLDDTTLALKKVEGDTYDVWDGLLNEIYEVLKHQLPTEEMDHLRKEQREWIDYRDNTAKEASLKYKGGTMEQYEYVRVENNLTEKRCFKLVEDFMK
ncbi:lysozyme inhibitor LprI family protein [Neobacillus novalis]|uniref:Lysozyme inhibitor LprI family protein n=1 Tax=Neobacillus novalis TaxID=220687 RepID=A0AA95SC97_9BACI|nr:lysozyme inhibitor LprI family protein [Neobacillus novalis]WHY87479.1 lysozyme inhibitor LprI family protein [Neobacillus novalis]